MRNEPRYDAIDLSHFATFGSQLSRRFGDPEADVAMRIRVVASDATVTGLLDQGSNLHTLETRLLHEALGRAGGNLAWAARLLGISCPQLAYRLKKRGVADKKASPANKPATLP